MNAKFNKTYRSKRSGKLVFMYTVHGTVAELEAYRDAQGINLRETVDGTPLFYSTSYKGERTDLICTSEGKIIADTSEFDKMASLAEAYGGNLGAEIAKAAAQNLMGYAPKAAAPATAPKVVAPEAPEAPEAELQAEEDDNIAKF